MILEDNILWFFLIIGFFILISIKIKSLFVKIGIGISFLISGSVLCIPRYLDSKFHPIIVSFVYPLVIFLVIVVIYFLFIKKELKKKSSKKIIEQNKIHFSNFVIPKVNIVNKKLLTNLIPKKCWGKNGRNIEPYKSKWENIRRIILKKTEKCVFCGVNKTNDVMFECHEEWKFNHKNKLQKLDKIIALCHKCHEVKHIGNTKKSSLESFLAAKKHMSEVNNWSETNVIEHINESLDQINKFNEVQNWNLDMIWLDSFIEKNNL